MALFDTPMISVFFLFKLNQEKISELHFVLSNTYDAVRVCFPLALDVEGVGKFVDDSFLGFFFFF